MLDFDSLSQWWSAVSQRGVLLELLALALCGVLAFGVTLALRRVRDRYVAAAANAVADDETAAGVVPRRPSVLLGHRGAQGILLPALWLLLTHVVRAILGQWQPTPLLSVALPALVTLTAVQAGVTVLRAALPGVAAVRFLARIISWGAWVALALWVTGILPLTLELLDNVVWKVGHTQISVRTLLQGVLTAGTLMLLALWISTLIESRLLLRAKGASLSLRKVIVNVVRAFMVFIGLLLGMEAVGIDLTALSVFGGALGVGIGLGLQKLAANYISGFLVLAERSVRIGDLVRVAGFEGRISDIRTRYTIVRSLGGVEAIVPNETLMTSMVENLSLSDARVSASTQVTVGYDSDVDLVQRLLIEAALECPRVLREPAPSVQLVGFGTNGLDFTAGYTVGDPENGLGSVRSQVNLAILRRLRAQGIDIPYPQRVLHMAGAGNPAADAFAAQHAAKSPCL
jgi:small-conductance mechanosensitive channel